MSDESAANLIDTASAGVQDLAAAATSALAQAGPAGALAVPVVDALRNVWEGYFGSPIPPDGTNWNSYSHEELYQMLWQNADVGDVSSMAAEWGQHRTELADHAESMRHERNAMQTNWSSESAGLATSQLGELGDRTSGISDRAGTVQGATQEAGDALAVARNTMPPPPGDPTGSALTSAMAGAGAGAVIGGIVGAGAGGIGAAPGAAIGAAIGAVAAGGGSLFMSNVAAAQKKAEAVHVMQQYEASLRNSSQAIAPPGSLEAAGFNSPASTTAAGFSGGAGSGSGGGVPWGRLVGAEQLGGGARSGFGALDAALARSGGLGGLAGRTGSGSMMPGAGGARRGEEEDEQLHENRLPTIDQKLFDDDRPASAPVIG
ncbi:hypothetical protein SAMN05421805_1011581 [Saccharopolyspora antimicrobica]|uniref:PPE family protein n=1 Tax=Saccharopolyspora antimicrobica TaxID=455193 RepID=A0A1I4TU23_9PSEU|nr:hypothetical protein [Saccharopolyspora antimicrobica]RKT88558.1 hypothetical protein ATL45_6996 [Saccharopolyspora antimicrobica]SFM80258.1 hypothetical protein SAMN05421805_1011581 [Saccharopolyspora antimicrobica]